MVTVAVDGFNVTLGTSPPGKYRFTLKDSVSSNILSLSMEMVNVPLGRISLSVSRNSVAEKSSPPVVVTQQELKFNTCTGFN